MSTQRVFDLITSSLLICFLMPFLLYRGTVAYWQTKKVFDCHAKIGYRKRPFYRLEFAGDQGGKTLAVLINVFRNDLAWAGVRALASEEADKLPTTSGLHHFDFKPGVVSAYIAKKNVGLDYDDEFETDYEFFSKVTLKAYIGLCLRALISAFLDGNNPREAPPILHFWGINIVNTTMSEALDWIEQGVQNNQKALVAFVNPGCLNIAYTNQAYHKVLQNVDRILPDGIGIKIGCRLLNQSLLANINGTDLFPRLCERAAEHSYSLFLLGGMDGVAEKAAIAMQQSYPNLKIAGFHDGYFTEQQESSIIEMINHSGAAILLVGFGVPKQELWLALNREQLNPSVCMGIGGLFDYYSGRIPRAPVWMREIGLEWSWRLMQEPSRMWKRYIIGNPLFLYRVWLQRQQKVKSYEQ